MMYSHPLIVSNQWENNKETWMAVTSPATGIPGCVGRATNNRTRSTGQPWDEPGQGELCRRIHGKRWRKINIRIFPDSSAPPGERGRRRGLREAKRHLENCHI